jgi:hypothetical protein
MPDNQRLKLHDLHVEISNANDGCDIVVVGRVNRGAFHWLGSLTLLPLDDAVEIAKRAGALVAE